MAFLKQLLGFRMVATQRGDDLRKIALRELGDASQWVHLANINNLMPPYIVDSLLEVTSSQVLLAGAMLKVPAPVTAPTGVTDEASVLGTDLHLVDGMLTDDGAGDIGTLSDVPNLQQALEHRLATRQGELVYHPRYGDRVHELVGKGNGPVPTQLAASWTAKCLNSDPRVSAVRNPAAATAGDTISVSAAVVPIQGKALPVGATVGP